MITTIGILLTLTFIYFTFWPILEGFVDGYMDAKNGKPYKNINEYGEEEETL